MRGVLAVLFVTACAAVCAVEAADAPKPTGPPARMLCVDPKAGDDGNPGTSARPLKTLDKALQTTAGGEVILLRSGRYPAVTINKVYPRTVTLRAEANHKPVLESVHVDKAARIALEGLTFFVPDARSDRHVYVRVNHSEHVAIRDVAIVGEINDDWKAKKSVAIGIGDSNHVSVVGGTIHHVQFGVTCSRCRDLRVAGMNVGPFREDGIRFKNCVGVVCEDNHVHHSNKTLKEHCDGIQMIYWSHDVVLRNNHIHDVNQGIGAFAASKQKRRNWRVEGNLIYNQKNPNTLSIFDADAPVIIHNTLPQAGPRIKGCTGAVVMNNIFAFPGSAADPNQVKREDYNLFVSAERTRQKPKGAHDLLGVDPRFVDANGFDFRLRPDSPAIDAAAGEFGRRKDLAGNAPYDHKPAPNRGAGKPPYLDLGALEYVPRPTSKPDN
ncbi:MAG TPA: right-handed parallel beta-helix repeat-containing protein [Phycisphaerae bacterium]|nr:right-handed parallel beta-helix repeat-containing protein [Phycisphaerae bacterium]